MWALENRLWLLFSNYFKINIGMLAVAKINGGFISAQFFYFICDMDLFTINIISFLIADGPTDLERCNATEDLSAGTGFGANF